MKYTFIDDKDEERRIIDEWMKHLYEDTLEDRSGEIHITDLTNPCLRQVVLRKKRGVVSYDEMDKNFLKKTWAGKKLHETPFGEIHEYAFRYWFDNGDFGYIVGSADEILDGIVIDKKFYAYIPNKPYEHHVEQVLFYIAVMTDYHEHCEDGKCELADPLDVKRGAVMYINRDKMQTKVYIFEPLDIAEIREEMIYRASIVRKGMLYDIIPEGNFSYFCKWCEFKDECDVYKREMKK